MRWRRHTWGISIHPESDNEQRLMHLFVYYIKARPAGEVTEEDKFSVLRVGGNIQQINFLTK